MVFKYKSNLCGGILSIVFSVVLFFMIPKQIAEDPASAMAMGINSRTVPYAMAILIFICGLYLIFQSIVLKKDTTKEIVLKKEALALVYAACIIVFAVLFKESYLLATLFLGLATLVLLKCRKPLFYAIEIALIIGLFFLFKMALGVRLPTLFL